MGFGVGVGLGCLGAGVNVAAGVNVGAGPAADEGSVELLLDCNVSGALNGFWSL